MTAARAIAAPSTITAPFTIAAGSPAPLDPLDALRRRGIRMLAAIGWASVALLVAADAWLGSGSGVVILVAGCAVNAGPTLMALQGRSDAEARLLTGTLAAIIPALLVFVLRDHPWQMDGHMYFFVAMAALVVLADWKPIALVSVLVAIHHAAFEWLVPSWVFTGSGNVGRLFFHVAAVLLQCGILGIVTVQLERLIASQGKAVGDAREATRLAEEERRRAETAMDKVQAAEVEAAGERRRREDQARRTVEERRGELMTLANEFERSVSSVVIAIGGATARLESAAIQLDDTAGQAGREAGAVAVDAVAAAGEITQVASSIRSLSDSIVTIAAAADQQAGLTDAATREASRSVRTIATLEEQAAEVEGFVEDIRRIAIKTNLLALNATIEAARAGDAGRGFAVVATEVKSLSADTTRASDKIIGLLTGIREGVADTGGKLRHVDGAIRELEFAAGGISSAVDEQRGVVLAIDAGARRAVSTADDIEQLVGRVATAVGSVATLSNDLRSNVSSLAGSARALRSATDLFVSFLQTEQAA